MTLASRWQGRLFCAVALAMVAAAVAGRALDPSRELTIVAVLILLLGVPHGSLDVVLARRLLRLTNARAWAVFSLGYVGSAALVVGLWFVAPTLFLGLFLFGSALHFAGDPTAGVSRFARGLYGGAILVLPALRHAAELERLLGLVAGPASAALVVPLLSRLATPWLCATLVVCALQVRTYPAEAMELFALAAVSVTVPPLLAFAIYFCAMHSPRHILRTVAALDDREARKALALALWPTAMVLAAAVVVGLLADGIPLEQRVMQLVFVGLAALTLPHMALLEQVRRIAGAVEHRPMEGTRRA